MSVAEKAMEKHKNSHIIKLHMRGHLVVIVIILLFAILYLYILYSPTPSPEPTPDDTLNGYTTQLQLLNKKLKVDAPVCLGAAFAVDNATIDTITKTAQSFIANKDNKPSTDAVNAYIAIQTTITTELAILVNTLLPCTDYCFQGTYNDTAKTCVCANPSYPVPIQQGGRVYCASDDCSMRPHAHFIPGKTTDPSTNTCSCDDGYTNVDGVCMNNQDIVTAKLRVDIATIVSTVALLVKTTTYCKGPHFTDLLKLIATAEQDAETLINDKTNPPTQQAIDDYHTEKDASQKTIFSLDRLPSCKQFCIQGTYNDMTGECNCDNSSYSKKIMVDNKVYCFNTDCSEDIHSHFQPGTADPSTNTCACNADCKRYPDASFCQNEMEHDTKELNGYGSKLSTDYQSLYNNLPTRVDVYGMDQNKFHLYPRSDINRPVSSHTITDPKLSLDGCSALAIKQGSDAFSFQPNAHVCTLYQTDASSSRIQSDTSICGTR